MFSSSFWEGDFLSTTGFETIVSRLKEGRQTCKDIEEFLKARAKAEDDFAKALLKIAKVERGTEETGTLKNSIKLLHQEAEIEASLHLAHSQYIQEEAKKLEEFREKQREEKKRHEDAMHKAHKIKADNYRRMQTCKSGYESKFKASEKADSELERIKFGNKPKDVERARKQQLQNKNASTKADEDYRTSINQLEIARKAWEQDHRNACEVFQRLEEERLQYLRNALWIYANLGSELFVKSDESREAIRLSLENCDIDSDIADFISRKSTGNKPLTSVVYTPCGGSTNHQQIVNNNPRPSVDYSSTIYAGIDCVNTNGGESPKMYSAMYEYSPATNEEIRLNINDRIAFISVDSDGWMKGRNLKTGQTGLFPANYVAPER